MRGLDAQNIMNAANSVESSISAVCNEVYAKARTLSSGDAIAIVVGTVGLCMATRGAKSIIALERVAAEAAATKVASATAKSALEASAGLEIAITDQIADASKHLVKSLPRFDATGYLPPGSYNLSWPEFRASFAVNGEREHLANGMQAALTDLKRAGCRRVEIGGSFVSSKPFPKDYDLVWFKKGVSKDRLDSVISSDSYWKQADKYGGELFEDGRTFSVPATTVNDMIRTTRNGRKFGIVSIDLTKPLPAAENFKPCSYGRHSGPMLMC